MTTRIVRIGNSQGVRLPRRLLDGYGLSERSEVEVTEVREGILLSAVNASSDKLSWADAYRAMAADRADRDEWSQWDVVVADGFDD